LHQKRSLSAIALSGHGIFARVMVSPTQTVAVGVATSEFHNSALVYGLHVALPGDMRNFQPIMFRSNTFVSRLRENYQLTYFLKTTTR
jgi:hypothetical protein